MEFQALYYQDRLKIVNPEGDVAITTLWSKVESAYQILEEAGLDLAPATSRIGPIANRGDANRWRDKLLGDGYNAIVQP